MAKARDLRALTGLVHGFLSADLARETRVGNIKDGNLALIAANSAAAAKLRLLGPALSQLLLERRFQVNSVSVRVQPNASRKAVAAPHQKPQLSANTLQSLRKLHASLADSPAREALKKLLARQR